MKTEFNKSSAFIFIIYTLFIFVLIPLDVFLWGPQRREARKDVNVGIFKHTSPEADEIVCLISSIINSECTNCSKKEKQMIASVILNRSDIKQLTVQTILEEPNQFQGINGKQFFPTPENDRIAVEVLTGSARNNQVLYFYSGSPEWSKHLISVKREGWHHTFSY